MWSKALLLYALVSHIVLDSRASGGCDFNLAGSRADVRKLDMCITNLLQGFGIDADLEEEDAKQQMTETCIGIMRGLGSQFTYANKTRRVCWETPNLNMTSVACEVLNAVAWEIKALALRHLAICSGFFEVAPDEESMEQLTQETFTAVGEVLKQEIELHDSTPLGFLLGLDLRRLRDDLLEPMVPGGHTRQLVSRLFAFSGKAFQHVNWMIWRDTHYLWLQDCLKQGKVVHSAWGDISRWEELGANDAHSNHVLQGAVARAPLYSFVDEGSQRTDILTNLLKKLYQSHGSQGEIVVVEIGVFRATFSRHILEQLPFVRLVGVDPYIGKDGTFPGNFSETLDPDAAFNIASSFYQSFGERATLLPMTSQEAAAHVPDRSVDAIFVDGCHLYECVDEDISTWMPKLTGQGSLVAGHDFSPQWPGVVRAVHEHRIDGQRVHLGMDWTYWWYLG